MGIRKRGLTVVTFAAAGIVTAGAIADLSISTAHSAAVTIASPVNGNGQIFRAIVFGQGQYAKMLGARPSLAPFYSAEYAQHNSVVDIDAADKVVHVIAAKDPQYFANFERKIRSGNPFVVADAVDGISDQLHRSGVISDVDASVQPSVYMNFHVNQNAYVNVNVGVNENVLANVNVYKAPVASLSPKNFDREQLIADITTTFS